MTSFSQISDFRLLVLETNASLYALAARFPQRSVFPAAHSITLTVMKVKRVKPTKSKGKKVRPAEDPAESVRLANPLDELKQEDPATTRGDEPMLDETASSDEGFSDSDQEVTKISWPFKCFTHLHHPFIGKF